MKAILTALLVLMSATNAYAIQQHPGVEGYFVHQLAHIIFGASMAYVMVALRRSTRARLIGWRLVRYAALFFMLWNVDTFLGHAAGRKIESAGGYIKGQMIFLKDPTAYVYYVTGMFENFFLVAAFVLLAIGLNRLYAHLKAEEVK